MKVDCCKGASVYTLVLSLVAQRGQDENEVMSTFMMPHRGMRTCMLDAK